MAKVIAHQYWLQLTNAGALSIRSMALRKIDSALERYHQQSTDANLNEVRKAFASFALNEPNWIRSPRNRYRAFEILKHDLDGTSTIALKPAEQVAWKMIYDESQALVQKLFQGKSLEWRAGLSAKLGKQRNSLVMSTMNIARNSLTVADEHPTAMAREIFSEVVPNEVQSAVAESLQEVMPGFMQDLAASVTPFAGVLYSAAKTLKSGVSLIGKEIKLDRQRQHAQQAFSTNEPALATQALLRILRRERNATRLDLAVNASSFTAKLASALADGGTVGNAAIGLATSAVKLINILRIITVDCLERHAANKHMSRNSVTAAIFDDCPILGAYMICCVPASALMNAFFAQQAVVGWTGQAEYAWKNHWAPLRENARELIQEHRFVIKGLEHHPGVISPNTEAIRAG